MGHTSLKPTSLDDLTVAAFNVLKGRLCSGRPKVFEADEVAMPALIFTDGALEYDMEKPVATIGAVLIMPDGMVQTFGASVPTALVQRWQESGKTHVIGLVELYACVVAYLHWRPLITTNRLIMFVDNWPALDVLVKGTSMQKDWRDLLLLLEDPEEDYFLFWIARVPSPSNIADHPSRGVLGPLGFLSPFSVVTPKCPISKIPLELIVNECG